MYHIIGKLTRCYLFLFFRVYLTCYFYGTQSSTYYVQVTRSQSWVFLYKQFSLNRLSDLFIFVLCCYCRENKRFPFVGRPAGSFSSYTLQLVNN
jgi:hypothetical protein